MMRILALLAVAALTVVAFSPADPAPPPAHTWEVFQNPEFRDRPNGVELR